MKRFILYLSFCCLATYSIHASDRFTITGTLTNANDTDKMEVAYMVKDSNGNWQRKTDVFNTINGRFQYSGDIDGITPFQLYYNAEPAVCMLFIEPGNITLCIDAKTPYSPASSNVSTWGEQQLYNAILHENDSLFFKSSKSLLKLAPTMTIGQYNTMRQYRDSLHHNMQSKSLSFAQQHLSYKIAPGILYQVLLDTAYLDEVKAIYNELSSQSKSSNLGELLTFQIKQTEQLIAKLIEDKKRTAVGMDAPLFTRITNTGKTISLEDYRGKYVMLDFWASWCQPCMKNLPTLKALYDNNKDKTFTIIGLSCDNDEAAWRKAIVAEQLKWDNVLAKQSQVDNLDISDVYNVWSVGIPTYILIDKAGKIAGRWNYLGDEEIKFIQGLIDKDNEL